MAELRFTVDGVEIIVPQLTRDALCQITARDRKPVTGAAEFEVMARDIIEMLSPSYPFVTAAWVDNLDWDIATAVWANLLAQVEIARAEQRRALLERPGGNTSLN
jgi:hypothetical protein